MFSTNSAFQRRWSQSTTQEMDPDSWFNDNQTAKEFQEKIEDKQKKEIINEIENSLSLSKRTTLYSTSPIIDFLINEPVLTAEQEPLFDLTNETKT